MRKEKIDLKNGSKNIWLLGSSSLFNDIGSEMIAPVLPFLISSLGGGGIAIGALSGLREGLASLFKLFGGWYSDKIGKRIPFIFLGYLVSVICRFLLVIASSWHHIIGIVSLERLGKLRDAPRDAIIAASTERRGRGFGIHQMLDTSGGILGALLVLILFWKFNFGFRKIILIAGAISILSLIPLYFVKEPKFRAEKKSLLKGIASLSKNLKYFIFVAAIFALGNFGLYMFLLLRAKMITGSIAAALGLGVLFNLVWAALTVPFGSLSDKVGRKKVLMIGYVLFFLVSLGFVYLGGISSLVILFVLYGVVYAITQSNQRAFVSDIAGRMKGTALGFYQFVTGLGNILGGITAGILWDISYQTMFGYISVVAFFAIVFLMFVRE